MAVRRVGGFPTSAWLPDRGADGVNAFARAPVLHPFSKFGGGPARSAVQNSAAWVRAKEEIAAGQPTNQGAVLMESGVHVFAEPMTQPTASSSTNGEAVSIAGVGGPRSTILRRDGDFVLMDCSGAHASTITTAYVKRASFRDLSFDGNGSGGGSQPLVRAWYAENLRFRNVEFSSSYGAGFDAIECWDTWFSQCFFRDCGGRDGVSPSTYVRCEVDGATTGMGHSADSSNNIWFDQCRWEQWRDGALWFQGNANNTQGAQMCFVTQAKFENHVSAGSYGMRGPAVKLDRTRSIFMSQMHFVLGGRDTVDTQSATYGIHVLRSRAPRIRDVLMAMGSDGGTESIDAFIHMDGSTGSGNSYPVLRDIDLTTDSAGVHPSTALIKWSGTNSNVRISGVAAPTNAASTTLTSGSATSVYSEPTWT